MAAATEVDAEIDADGSDDDIQFMSRREEEVLEMEGALGEAVEGVVEEPVEAEGVVDDIVEAVGAVEEPVDAEGALKGPVQAEWALKGPVETEGAVEDVV